MIAGTLDRPATSTELLRKEVQLLQPSLCIGDRQVRQQATIAIEGNHGMTAGMGIQAEYNHEMFLLKKEECTRDASLQRSCESAPWYLATTGAYLPCGESCHSAYSHLQSAEQLSSGRLIVSNSSPLSRYTDFLGVCSQSVASAGEAAKRK